MSEKFSHLYTDNIRDVKASAIREICKLIAKPNLISLAGGWPDPESFPVKETKELFDEVMKNHWQLALQYGTSEGLTELRDFIVQWAKKKEKIDLNLDQVIIASGSQNGIDLSAKVLVNPGDVVFVGLPTYFVTAFQIYGAQIEGVPVDENGMQVDVLEEKLAKSAGKGKLIYIQPNFQNPSGATLTLERREKVLKLADQYDLIIVEDNPYGDLNYEGQWLPSLKSLDRSERVIYLRSFSKIFSPGVRLAWVAGEANLIRKMVVARQYVDCCSNSLSQYIVYEFCKRGYLDKQIQKNIQFYKQKRDFMLEQLDKHFPKSVKWNKPRGGFFVFVTLPENIDADDVLHRAVYQNVAFVSGHPFFFDGSGRNTFRLSFAQSGMDDIETAIKRLGTILTEII